LDVFKNTDRCRLVQSNETKQCADTVAGTALEREASKWLHSHISHGAQGGLISQITPTLAPRSKLNLYSKRMHCLGHIIDDRGIHADTDKMAHVCEWRTPRNKYDVQ
jgi:hypothetical protein